MHDLPYLRISCLHGVLAAASACVDIDVRVCMFLNEFLRLTIVISLTVRSGHPKGYPVEARATHQYFLVFRIPKIQRLSTAFGISEKYLSTTDPRKLRGRLSLRVGPLLLPLLPRRGPTSTVHGFNEITHLKQ